MRPAADIGIVATASYIPQTRVALARLAEHASACATSPREALMQSVYEDTIRWRQMEPACTAPLAAENTVVKLPYDSGMRAVAVESTMLLSDMALHVARPLVTRKGDDHARGTTDLFVVCHSSLEHDLTLSSACRLQCELKQGRAPFAVGQLQGASFLMALQTVAALMATEEELERALIVASERWRGPFSRVTGSLTALGDGAGAALVQRGATSGWILRSINVRTPAVASQTDDTTASPSLAPTFSTIDPDALADVIDQTCRHAGVRPAAIDWVVPAYLNLALVHKVSARCGLPLARTMLRDFGDTGHLCSADTPVRLDALLRAIEPRAGQRILTWAAGLQGQVACAVLEFSGGDDAPA